MLIDISPLKKYPDFRWLYFGQFISLIGTMISYVAVPYQVYELTHNNAIVGALGVVQLVPLIVFSMLGGTYADRLDRQKLLITCELLMGFFTLLLVFNTYLATPNLPLVFILTALIQAINGFHRPAMEAITQQMISDPKDYPSAGSLASFRYSISAIVGPSLAGLIIAAFGLSITYLLDAVSFMIAVGCLLQMKKFPFVSKSEKSTLEDMKDGLRYARSKPELMGTYIVDIVAMTFAMPVALYPAMSVGWGGAKSAGWLFSAMAVGAVGAAVFSGWCRQIRMRGRGVVISAFFWGLFVVGAGVASQFSTSMIGFGFAFAFLALAGAADMFSALFRKVIWNETIPNYMRGRLSGIEMISFTAGPLLGNARAGYMASKTSVPFSLTMGGLLCVFGVALTAYLLPKFWKYKSE
jgi:MFS family permease